MIKVFIENLNFVFKTMLELYSFEQTNVCFSSPVP